DDALACERRELVARQAEEPSVDLVVVLAETRRAAPDRARRTREARVDPLHAERPDDRVVHRDDVAARRDVRVGEDVRRRVGDAEGDLMPLEDVRDLARRSLPAPIADDGIDRLAVLGAEREGGEARIGEQVLAPHGAREAREESVAAATMQTNFPSRVSQLSSGAELESRLPSRSRTRPRRSKAARVCSMTR